MWEFHAAQCAPLIVALQVVIASAARQSFSVIMTGHEKKVDFLIRHV